MPTAEFATGIGRLSFICGGASVRASIFEPCYAHWANLRANDPTGRGRSACRKLPLYVACALEFMGTRIEARKKYPSTTKHVPTDFCPRVDARAEGHEVMIGGWLPIKGTSGSIDKNLSPWFSIGLCEETAPWAYCRGGEPYRTIAALEAMATLVSIVAFSAWLPRHSASHVTVTSLTDNQGNKHALKRLAAC